MTRTSFTYWGLVAIPLLCGATPLRAGEVAARVTYVAWKTLYLNAGRAQGVENGLNGLLYRGESLVGEITVAATADSTCVATLTAEGVVALPGDRAIILLMDSENRNFPAAAHSPMHSNTNDANRLVSRQRKPHGRFTGRVSFQTDIYQDNSSTEVNPGATFRSTIPGVITNNSSLSLKYRGRQRTNPNGKIWQHRLYEAGLSFESTEQRWRASFGRIQAGSVAGIGYLDGAYGEVGLGNGFAVGAFGGAQAQSDLSNTDFSTTKGGVLLTHRRSASFVRRSQFTLAMAGEYVYGNLSREFIYQQSTLSLGNGFSLYESSDFNINRDWRRDAEGSALSLANMLANVRYVPFRSTTLSIGYDGRARYHEWESRETPDSLFDDAIRHGLRAGIELSFLHGVRLAAQQSYRSDPADDTFYPSGSYSLSTNSILHNPVGASVRFNRFSNRFSTGDLRSVSASWAPVRYAELRAEYGQTQYVYRLDKYKSDSNWMRASFDLNLRSGTYLSLQVDQSSTADETTVRSFIELGQRFR